MPPTNGPPAYPPRWKYSKHGWEEPDTIMCFKCQFFQPMEESGQAPQVRKGNRARGVIIEPQGASPEGFCRKKSVPITNYNAPMVLPVQPAPLYTQIATEDQAVPSTQSLQEVFQREAPEFWCRYWVRTATPFIWPPIRQ